MEKLQHKEYDFSSKLRQVSVVQRLKEYITWQRSAEDYDSGNPVPPFGPVSINLDLTSSCNFACPHCVDSTIINTGAVLELNTVKRPLTPLPSVDSCPLYSWEVVNLPFTRILQKLSGILKAKGYSSVS